MKPTIKRGEEIEVYWLEAGRYIDAQVAHKTDTEWEVNCIGIELLVNWNESENRWDGRSK